MNHDLEQALRESNSLCEGHFELSSGLHSSHYFQCARLLSDPKEAEKAGQALASLFKEEGVEAVIGPAIGGIVLSYVTARALNVPSYFAEKTDTGFSLRRGFRIRQGEKVLVVEDVITTGGSAGRVFDLIKELGGKAIGVGTLVLRGESSALAFPVRSLLTIDAPLYRSSECPLCQQNKAIEKPGSASRLTL